MDLEEILLRMKYTGSQNLDCINQIAETINEIPDENVQEEVLDKVKFIICEGVFGHVASLKISEFVPLEKMGPNYKCNHEIDIIILNFQGMEGMSKDFIKYTIAEEIAHFHLGDKNFGKPGGEEEKAKKLVISWGFKKEV